MNPLSRFEPLSGHTHKIMIIFFLHNFKQMKNILLYILTASLFFSCGTSRKMNRTAEYKNSEILYGKINRIGLETDPFGNWYNSGYKNYRYGQVYVDELKGYVPKISKIVVILATWCPDTRRELPRVLRILDDMDYPSQKIEMYAVDREKKTDVKGFDTYKFSRVPTVIFYDGDKEIGRIIEQPEMTLEEDMVSMFRMYFGNR
jgi:thiol-disulfide isomerase/thioredoxin